MRQVVVAALFFVLAFASAEYENKSEDDFLKASEQCSKEINVPQSYESKFEKFDYPDEPIVKRYLHCVWKRLELWDDKTGFNVEHIADLYKEKADTKDLVPILTECNRNEQNDEPLNWVHRGFKCILESRIGTWFKEDVTAHVSKQ